MNHRFVYFLLCILLACCTKQGGTQDGEDGGNPAPGDGLSITDVSIPENIVIKPGDAVKFNAKGIVEGDVIVIEGSGNFESEVGILGETLFSFTIPQDLKTGAYDIVLKRGEQTKTLASVNITIITGDDIPDVEGKNVKGIVHCNGKPVEGVVVSDGLEVTVTNAYGMYWIYSKKRTDDYVFISVPSGYKVQVANGVVPQSFQRIEGSESYTERHDFELVEEPGQDTHRILILGDMHLADRENNDVAQFQDFIADINPVVASTTVPVYGLTLGDMTWDKFWYSNNFTFKEYIREISKVKNLPIYHTIGNHDHELGYNGNWPVGDYATASKFKADLGPTYYSFNIGKIHYVVLDDIECTNDGTGSGNKYNVRLTADQVDWLKKDLSYVDKSATLVVASHSQIHSKKGGLTLENYDDLMTVLDDFKNVHIFTGHTHLVYNWVVEGFYDNITEHNAGAICATWWWSGKHSDIHICQDGAPGGYTIMDVDGDDLKWQYKATGKDVGFQFRTYDGNQVHITKDDCRGQESAKQGFIDNYVDNPYDWSQKRSDNAVFINVWNWDPSWKVEVTENGKKLNVEKVSLRDPLHLVAYTGKSMAGVSTTDTFATSVNEHFFRVYASAANTTLEIKVTDRFGNIYTETMTRPKTFSIENYK